MAGYLGIDIGSVAAKGVLIDESSLLAQIIVPSGNNFSRAAEDVLSSLLARSGIDRQEIKLTVATGVGSSNVSYCDQNIVDTRCCARGIHWLFPSVHTVIDVGGQGTQVITLGEDGQIAGFLTGEKCASGSGYFLEMIANVLQVPLEELGPLSLKSADPVTFTTSCAVFGESEAVSRIAEGMSAADIAAGVHKAMAEKIGTMIERLGLRQSCAVCGGGALDSGLVKTLEEVLGIKLLVPEEPRLVNALGAALLARDKGKSEKV